MVMSDASRDEAAERAEVAAADKVVGEHPELVSLLNDGDPGALLALLEAAGGKVSGATLKIVARRSAAAG